MKIGWMLLRAIVGLLFAGHGAQKLFGWFGGAGPEGTGQFFHVLGLRPGKRHALAAGAAETGGGLLLATGTLTPVAGAALSGTMITAVRQVHLAKGLWVTDGGFEYNLVLLGVLFALTEERSGPWWAVAQLIAGAAGSTAAIELGRRAEAAPEQQGSPAASVGGQPEREPAIA